MDDTWPARVVAAAAVDDPDALAALFAERAAALGHERASRDWLAALGGYDAGAQTG